MPLGGPTAWRLCQREPLIDRTPPLPLSPQLSGSVPLTSRLPGTSSGSQLPVGINYSLTFLGGWMGTVWRAGQQQSMRGGRAWLRGWGRLRGAQRERERAAHAPPRRLTLPPAAPLPTADGDMLIGRASSGIFIFTRDADVHAAAAAGAQ